MAERYAATLARDRGRLPPRTRHRHAGRDRPRAEQSAGAARTRSTSVTSREPCIIISHDLTPSNTAQLDKRNVLGFATDVGSKTSHTAIMARSLRIPAVVGLARTSATSSRPANTRCWTGSMAWSIVNPTDQTLFEYGQLVRKAGHPAGKAARHSAQAGRHPGWPSRYSVAPTSSRRRTAEQVKANGAEGVGLFRTEYLFINRDMPPSEEQQYQAYREAAARSEAHAGGHPHPGPRRRQVPGASAACRGR